MTEQANLYRKKPVVIEARQLTRENWSEIVEWAVGSEIIPASMCLKVGSIRIPTLEGDHIATPGDFIIKGVKGEFYPCKPDIFELTYEAVQ